MKRYFFGLPSVIVVLFWISQPSSSFGQNVPEEAVRAANEHLRLVIIPQAQEDDTFLKRRFDIELVGDYSRLWLDEPYAEYWMGAQAIYDFADGKNSVFAGGLDVGSCAFPVFFDQEYVFTIRVSLKEDGWAYSGGVQRRGNVFEPWLFDLRKQYPPEDGYQLSTVVSDGIGNYLLLHNNDQLIKIAPMLPFSARNIGLETDEKGIGPLVPVGEVEASLRARAVEYKQKWEDSSVPHEE